MEWSKELMYLPNQLLRGLCLAIRRIPPEDFSVVGETKNDNDWKSQQGKNIDKVNIDRIKNGSVY